jgi:hypothetical protein
MDVDGLGTQLFAQAKVVNVLQEAGYVHFCHP